MQIVDSKIEIGANSSFAHRGQSFCVNILGAGAWSPGGGDPCDSSHKQPCANNGTMAPQSIIHQQSE